MNIGFCGYCIDNLFTIDPPYIEDDNCRFDSPLAEQGFEKNEISLKYAMIAICDKDFLIFLRKVLREYWENFT